MKTTSLISVPSGARSGIAPWMVAGLSLAFAGVGRAAPPSPPATPVAYQGWAAMADTDIDFSIRWSKEQSILAVYPAPATFAATLVKARQQADLDLRRVTSFEGYRQAMKHFFSVFNDAHAYASVRLTQTSFQWPGFLAVYRGHHFVVAGSEGGVADGAQITSCDGLPMTAWIERIAPYENIIPGLESTRAAAAPLVFRDAGSPFLARPVRCVIDGKTIELDWHRIAQPELAQIRSRLKPRLGDDVTVAPFGNDGAWVRMGNFSPMNKTQSDQFEALYKAAPSLRGKSVIVLDVRGNGGGPYEWFMGVLRSLYGTDYANYHARARLQIAAVYRLAQELAEGPAQPSKAPGSAPAAAPPDGVPYDEDDRLSNAASARGETVFRAPVNPHRIPLPTNEPPNPVRARVLVLTDYDCASACIGFVDELKRFPGVIQIGVETGVDSRTGTPMSASLPSGNGAIGVPNMTRDGRARGDNEPQKPSVEFEGDIDDTPAVQAWIREVVLRPAHAP